MKLDEHEIFIRAFIFFLLKNIFFLCRSMICKETPRGYLSARSVAFSISNALARWQCDTVEIFSE